jgi:hypothetical protein
MAWSQMGEDNCLLYTSFAAKYTGRNNEANLMAIDAKGPELARDKRTPSPVTLTIVRRFATTIVLIHDPLCQGFGLSLYEHLPSC